MQVQCRVAKSLGELEGHPNDVWNTIPYTDRDKPVVFFGLYDLRDYIALFRHRGKKWVLWSGSDLRNLRAGFMLNDGKLRLISKILRRFPKYYEHYSRHMAALLHEASHYVENEFEAEELGMLDIECKVVPSFMGNVDLYTVNYYGYGAPNVYVSCGQGRQEEYGFDTIERIAPKLSKWHFHLYGDDWDTKHKNVIVHGRVSKSDMNMEIMKMRAGIRLNEYDGFSEILAKSILWGQHPISRLKYEYITHFTNDDELIDAIKDLDNKRSANIEGRTHYRKWINRYPWAT